VVFSHGWYDLPSFEWEEREKKLRATAYAAGRVVDLVITSPARGRVQIHATFAGRASKTIESTIDEIVAGMLGLAQSFDDFYRQAGTDYDWAKQRGAGPFLRGATVFEDAVKMLATTNCSWSLTRQMMKRLVQELGEKSPSGSRAFPTPDAMAQRPVEFYRDVIRAGYRSAFFHQFAKAVADGAINVESWRHFEGSTGDLIKEIRSMAGFGPYAAENLCKLLGRFDGLGLDSWCLKKYPEIAGPIRGDVAKTIARRYERFGRWKGLALWLDLTRDWHEESPSEEASATFQKR
jgi:N-glycosylase/DNA lyase